MEKASAPTGGTPAGSPPDPFDDPSGDIDDDALAAQVEAMRAELAEAPVDVVVANHCYALFELAALHLSQQPPHLFESRLAIDALGCLVDGLEGRLGELRLHGGLRSHGCLLDGRLHGLHGELHRLLRGSDSGRRSRKALAA